MFDWGKLNWLNRHYIRSLTDDDLAERLQPFLPDLPPKTIRATAPALKQRLPRLDQAAEYLAYLRQPPPPPELQDGQREMLKVAMDRFQTVDWSPARSGTRRGAPGTWLE